MRVEPFSTEQLVLLYFNLNKYVPGPAAVDADAPLAGEPDRLTILDARGDVYFQDAVRFHLATPVASTACVRDERAGSVTAWTPDGVTEPPEDALLNAADQP